MRLGSVYGDDARCFSFSYLSESMDYENVHASGEDKQK